MARRKNKANDALIGVLVLLGGAAWIGTTIKQSIGTTGSVACVLGLPILIWIFVARKKAARLNYLQSKYADEVIVQNIMQRKFWSGQTGEQLLDSLGAPAAIDNNLLKTRKREIWKYQPSGTNRYRLRITLDDDVVVGWNQKN